MALLGLHAATSPRVQHNSPVHLAQLIHQPRGAIKRDNGVTLYRVRRNLKTQISTGNANAVYSVSVGVYVKITNPPYYRRIHASTP